MIQTIYRIPAPDSIDSVIEVYGDPNNAWYEWRIIDGTKKIVRDTVNEGGDTFQGRQYGQRQF